LGFYLSLGQVWVRGDLKECPKPTYGTNTPFGQVWEFGFLPKLAVWGIL
jgi:hypothetical protein